VSAAAEAAIAEARPPAAAPAPVPGRGLEIRGLWKEYVPGRPVLRGIDLHVAPQGITAVIGPSGTGKSTLIRCINRLVEPTRGEVLLHGQRLTGLRRRALRLARRRIGMVFQEYNLVDRLSVMENVLCGRLGHVPVWRAWLRRYPPADIDRAFALLDAVGLPEHATRRADALSGGQRQRVGIARALMQGPELLLADEPTSSLDPKTAVEVLELLARLTGEAGVPVVINIHNVALARRFAGRIIGMEGGQVVFDGPPEALEPAHLRRIYGGEDWL
jgi:phosphonate transport system ATP-binding protein